MTEKFRVERNDVVGRYAIASTDLESGAEILTEIPFCVGPKSQTIPVCLGCYTFVDCSTLCSKCKWPVCSATCEVDPLHKNAECKIFSAANVPYQLGENPSDVSPQYDCITPLRMLLAKEEDPDRWEKEIKIMEAHSPKRKETDFWGPEQINVVDFLRDRCKLANRYNSDLIHKACGILEVNCFEIKLLSGDFIRGLYPRTAIPSHNCVANTTHTIYPSKNYMLQLRTTVNVMEGEEIFTSYTSALLPTFLRRDNLSYSKYFDCDCARCSDPTELGTHLSSLKCTKCDNGLIISSDPLDAEAIWKCTHCEFTLRADALRRIYTVVQVEINRLNAIDSKDLVIQAAEKLLKQYKSVLHQNNAFNTTVRHTLIQLYGRAEGYTYEDLPDILLERKIELCKQLLKVTDVLKPGKNRFRGMILYELHVPIMIFARNKYQYGEIDIQTLKQEFEEVASILSEAVDALILEDPESVDGNIGQIAAGSLQELRDSLKDMK